MESLRGWARKHSDGCTAVPDIYVECCWQHDYAYQNGRDFNTGLLLSRAEADRQFRRCIQTRSRLWIFSPVSWVRWLGVRLIGWRFWRGGVKVEIGQ